LIVCITGGIYWYLQSDKTSDLQSPATIKNTQEQLEEDIPAIPVNDSLMQGKDTANIWTNVAGKETISQSQQTVSPSTEKSSGVATTANVAKETLADTVEYDITGTKTNYTLREGESLVKLAVKFYGTKKLWPYIVKHNKNIIKDADRVPIGTTLRIPELTPKK
jgi:nucleoid-associated protein YgaU